MSLESTGRAQEAASFSDAADVDTATDAYARRFSGPVGAYFLEVQSRLVLDLLKDFRGCTVLDVGGGHAQVAGPLVDRGFQLTVAGSNPSCRSRLDRFLPPGSFRFQQTDLLRMPFEDRSFDVVVALRLISHVVQWRLLLEEMCRVSRQAVLLDYPDKRSLNVISWPFFALKKSAEGDTRRYRTFNRQEIVTEFARHGFGAPEARPEFILPMVAHRMFGRVGLTRAVESAGRAIGATRRFGSPVVLRVLRRGNGSLRRGSAAS